MFFRRRGRGRAPKQAGTDGEQRAPALTARILHLQRLSTEDGPGIRTTVFFKGCPLACRWCHNPESISPQPQVQWLEDRCVGYGTCVTACPHGCLELTPQGMEIDRECCTGCGACARTCPALALEYLGREVEVEALVTEVLKDRTYFATSGGGVTVSGGEPTLQARFVATFLRRLQQEGMRTALDTCGFAAPAALAAILPYTDLVLFDLKEIDPQRHRDFTGASNERVLDNLLFVRDHLLRISERAPAARLWIRTPLIPGATATRENLEGLGAFLAAHFVGGIERWELCAFNNLCRDKYRRLDLAWDFAETPLMTAAALEEAAGWAQGSGVDPEIVVVTGATQSE
ncbi:MAG: glycyl-radical enzyme activating protein [Anaerolineales bacterium]